MPDGTPSGMQGWFFNGRRDKFKDARIREAVGLAFDFEWTNATVMYGAYTRTASYFENSDLKAEGLPSPAELALLEPHRAALPPAVFGEPWSPPRSDGSGQERGLLRRASELLREAGCRRAGAQNLAGIADPVVDALLDVIVRAETRPALVTAVRALDRVLRAGRYWVPMWYRASRPLAYWDLFGRPPEPPAFGLGAPDTWWWDAEKARRIGRS